ncbi:hypothetical protein K469DRAFT_455080, partial [Zopfia rhizophila CBS 207.26]
SVFLVGSIEMGKAIDWQQELNPITIFNPRRDDWDKSWEQGITNPPFREQVTWELDRLDEADVIALFFRPGILSLISLLELGIHLRSSKLVVCCSKG